MSANQKFAVTGNPILHSKSPIIFNALFRHFKINAYYSRLVAKNSKQAISLFHKIGLIGMNVTAPYKSDIITELDNIDFTANKIGAVNTIFKKNNMLFGYNTDYVGVIEALKYYGIAPEKLKCIVLGAGSAGRAAAYGLMNAGANTIILNRTYKKAIKAAKELGCKFDKIENLNKLLNSVDLLISTIPNISYSIKNINLQRKELFIFDSVYNNSLLEKKAAEAGCKFIKGEELLIQQAIPAYKIFTGSKANERIIRNAILEAENNPGKSNNILLIGFMGCGKSTLGRILAEKLHARFIDTDELIELKEGRSISEIFADEGEKYFRKVEKNILHDLKDILFLQKNNSGNKIDSVISCGGGMVLNPENRNTLKNLGTVIWIYTDFDNCMKRIRLQQNERPLVKNITSETQLKQIFNERQDLYFVTSDLIIDNDELQEDAFHLIMKEILSFNTTTLGE